MNIFSIKSAARCNVFRLVVTADPEPISKLVLAVYCAYRIATDCHDVVDNWEKYIALIH